MKLEQYPTAEAFMPARITLPTLESAAAGCKGCDLYKYATQTVFGEGPRDARVMFVGEQPGDQEDKAGKPFVGPAGVDVDRARGKGGINPAEGYGTHPGQQF